MSDARYVSHSEFKTWRRCRRKWMIEYLWRVTLPKGEPGALGLGVLAHAGLQVITEGGSLEDAHRKVASDVLDALDSLDDERRAYVEESWIEAGADAQNYLTGYVEWLASSGADQRYTTYAAEEEMEMPLGVFSGREWRLRGKLDRRMYDRVTERVVFMDYKTCATFESITEAAYRNEQFPTYELLLRHNYPEERCGSGVWRMLRKVKRARGTSDGDDEYFRDTSASFNDTVLESVLRRYQIMAAEMQVVEEMTAQGIDVAYPSPDFRCSWDCPYKHECPMFDDGSRLQDAIEGQYVEFDPYARYEQKGSDV